MERATYLEIAKDISLAHRQLVRRQEHAPQRAGVLEDDSEKGRLRLRFPGRAVPKFDGEIARVIIAKHSLQEIQGDTRMAVLTGDHRAAQFCHCPPPLYLLS